MERISSSLEKIIYFGSGAEFDKRFDITYANETDIGRHIPESGYGFAKYIMNAQARHSDNIYNLRLFGIFGKYEDWRVKFISNLCCKAIFELPLTIRKECRFDYAFVDDLADIVLYFIENKPLYHDYNFAYGKPVLLTQIANMISLVSGKKQDIMLLDKVGFNKDYTANNERLKIETGFTPTPIEDAIEKLYQYYYDNRDIIDAKTLKSTR
ncbi:hypothetical protein AGMMS50276_32530 [Synergistales bacterium]|nr:hypothetical protein AGMMS50276_32530 [Synergistales bacterium]